MIRHLRQSIKLPVATANHISMCRIRRSARCTRNILRAVGQQSRRAPGSSRVAAASKRREFLVPKQSWHHQYPRGCTPTPGVDRANERNERLRADCPASSLARSRSFLGSRRHAARRRRKYEKGAKRRAHKTMARETMARETPIPIGRPRNRQRRTCRMPCVIRAKVVAVSGAA